jgi:hypothetical protein
MGQERGHVSKGVAATVVSEATQSETADEFVTRIVIDCAGNVGPLGDAIKAAGRGGDREVFAALQHKLGNSAAAAVMARAGRHTATATSLSKGNATIDRKTEESFQHDGGGVKNTRAVHGSVGKGGASGSASMSKHATAKDSTGQVVDSKTTTAAVAGSADHGSVDVAHEHTTDNKGKAITKAAKAHGEIGDKGPAGSASLSKKTETKAADGHVVATKATSAHAAGSADGGSLEVSRANSSDHNGQHRESSTAAKGAIDKDGPSGSIDRSSSTTTTGEHGETSAKKSTSAKVSAKGGELHRSKSHSTTEKTADGSVVDATESTKHLTVGPDGATGTLGKSKSKTTHHKAKGSKPASSTTTAGGVTGSATINSDTQAVSVGGNLGRTSTGGNGFNVGVQFDASRTRHQETKDGFTTLEIDTHVSGALSGGANLKHVGVKGSVSKGHDTSFTATVPEAAAKGLDLSKLDPSRPDLLPPGASLRIDSSKFKGSSFGASIEAISVHSADKKSKGTSLLIEKIDDKTVRVVAGPTEVLSRVTSFGLDFGGAGIALLGGIQLNSATLHAAEYDLANAESSAAYGQFVSGGHAPTPQTKGAHNVTTVERLDVTKQAGMKAHIGSHSIGGMSKAGEDHWITTTNPDGSKDVTNSFTNREKTKEYDAHIDANGKTTSETLTWVFKNEDAVASLLQMIPGVKLKGKASEFRYELTRAQLGALYKQAQTAVVNMKAQAKKETGNEHAFDFNELAKLMAASPTPDDFFWNFTSFCPNAFAEARMLLTISDYLVGTNHDKKYSALAVTPTSVA